MATPVQRLAAAMRLKDKVLKKEENEYNTDYSGGSSYYEKQTHIYLFDNHSCTIRKRTFTSLSSGGFSLPRETEDEVNGTWDIAEGSALPELVIKDEYGRTIFTGNVADGGTGIEYIDGIAWNRYLINHS